MRKYLAGYNLSNYQLSSSVYDPNSYAFNMFTDPSGNLFIGGQFTLVNYVDRRFLASLNLNTGSATSWDPSPNGYVNALAIKDSSLFVGGGFSSIGTNALSRSYLAAVNSKTGKALTTWSADANNIVYALGIKDSILYVGGAFTTVKSTSRNYAAALSTSNASVKTWAPNPNSYVFTLLPLNSYVYLGGYFATVKGSNRNYLAKVNNTNGNLTSWNPNPDFYPYSIVSSGNTVFVGGGFGNIASQTRYGIAAFDSATNALTSFNANLNNGSDYANIYALAPYGKNLYFAADYNFSTIGTTARGYLTGLDTATKAALAFNPMPDQYFNGNVPMSVGKNKLFVGGPWQSLGSNASPSYFAVFTLEPQTQASNLTFTNLQPTSVKANFTAGSGENRVVVLRQGSNPVAPNDGTGYTADSAF